MSAQFRTDFFHTTCHLFCVCMCVCVCVGGEGCVRSCAFVQHIVHRFFGALHMTILWIRPLVFTKDTPSYS